MCVAVFEWFLSGLINISLCYNKLELNKFWRTGFKPFVINFFVEFSFGKVYSRAPGHECRIIAIGTS